MSSAVSCCAATPSATRTSGRCSCTCRRGTTTSRTAGTRSYTSSRATPGTWPCGGTGRPFRQPFPEAADAVFARGDAPPAIVVYVDAWTRYGGSQFVDSPGTGRYHSYLCDEVVPWVDARYRTLPDAGHRAIMGKSSGGFGSMITPMLRPDLFGALATHAGDSLYEYCYIPDFATAVRHLRRYDGDIWRWWDDFNSRVAFTKEEDMSLLGLIGVAACFSANEDGTVDLPFDPVTGVLRPAVCGQRWLDWDPAVGLGPGEQRIVGSALRRRRRRRPRRPSPGIVDGAAKSSLSAAPQASIGAMTFPPVGTTVMVVQHRPSVTCSPRPTARWSTPTPRTPRAARRPAPAPARRPGRRSPGRPRPGPPTHFPGTSAWSRARAASSRSRTMVTRSRLQGREAAVDGG